MLFKKKNLLLLLALIALSACAGTGTNQDVPADVPPDAVTLSLHPPQTGFLNIGRTYLGILTVDGARPTGYDHTALLAPGRHFILLRSFNDPVAAYACLDVTLESGHAYVARTTDPSMDSTTIWIEDQATGDPVGEKVKAAMFKEPNTAAVAPIAALFMHKILEHPAPQCPLVPPNPNRQTQSAPGSS